MSRPLYLALSPYHLVTREPPAMAALILGTQVVTLLPAPAAGTSREDVRAAVGKSPRYLRLMESWRWSTPLWKEGVIGSAFCGDESAAEISGVYQAIRREDDLAALRPLVSRWPVNGQGEEIGEREAEKGRAAFLDGLAADLLKGGPDPGVNIPLTAALDRFAAAHDLVGVRSGTASVAQKAETRLGRKLGSFSVPVVSRASGRRMLELRHALRKPLDVLRGAIAAMVCTDGTGGGGGAVRSAAATYAEAFAEWAVEHAIGDDEEGQRITTAYLSVTAEMLPVDAALRSGRVAARSMAARGGVGVRTRRAATVSAEPAPEFAALVVREMAARPAGM